MKNGIIATLILGMILWAVVTWPLPKHFGEAVPYSEKRAEGEPAVTAFVPGDHIQLMYHFWLCRDMIAGKTPAFSNVYEFNTAGDREKFKFDTYYVPFSLVYALVSPLFGDAAGWNAAGLFSHLLGLAGFFLLAFRLCKSPLLAAGLAVTASAFPYKWISLICGSPTGFAMCFVPWLFYGMDRMVRDASTRGGLVAGLALLLSYCSDLHVFYFLSLATPPVFLLYVLCRDETSKPLAAVAKAALPLVACGVAAMAMAKLSSSNLGASTMAGGRTLREVRLFSPIASGIIRREHLAGASNQIFIGLVPFAFLLFGYVLFAFGNHTPRTWKKALVVALLSMAAASAYLLALGAYGPMDALPLRVARKLIPKYTMIRQSAKIFCLMPALLTALSAVLLAKARESRLPAAIALLLLLAATVEESSWFAPKICRLPKRAPAFEAVAATAESPNPKAICATLWPGDSHWSAAYEFGAMKSRVRLLNGYSPSVPADYGERVFKPLSSINEGSLSDSQLALLAGFGVDFVIFHENYYPSKVSPFPAGIALRELNDNPRLQLLCHEEGTAAFKITPANIREPATGDIRPYLDYPAAWHWDGHKTARSIETAPKGEINLKLRAPVALRTGLRFLLLDEAKGWFEIPLDNPMGGFYKLPEGTGNLKHMLVSAGTFPMDFSNAVGLTPAWMFHEGTSNTADNSVTFAPENTPAGVVLHGPGLPIPHGRYRLEVTVAGGSASNSGVSCGTLGDGACEYRSVPFSAFPGDTAAIEFNHVSDFPFEVRVSYGAAAEATVKAITLTKLE